MAAELPSGTVTFFGTDVVDSVAQWEADEVAMRQAITDHRKSADSCCAFHGGTIFKDTGDGTFAAFSRAPDAILAALATRTAQATTGLATRYLLHLGTVSADGDDYHGQAVNRLARVLALCTPHRVYATRPVRDAAIDHLKDRVAFRELGVIRLRGMSREEVLFQVEWIHDPEPVDFVPEQEAHLSTIPGDAMPFVGRSAEVAEISEQLGDRAVRVLTITGFGGMGKTRLAKHVAGLVAPHHAEGIRFVECESLQPQEVLLKAADALGLAPTSNPIALGRAAADREVLLVFDCFERVLAAATELETMLRFAPKLRILVTSRVTLGIAGEVEYPLLPMGTHPRSQDDPINLFLQSAGARFEKELLSKKALVKEVCQRVENVPLGIVLAAGRLRHLSITELRDRLEERMLEVLRTLQRPNDRQRDLPTVIKDSLDLLAPEDRTLLESLRLFSGFYLEDAEVVLSDCVLDGIATLRDHSLLISQTRKGKTRYRMLDSIREYLELGAPVSPEVQAAFGSHFARRAEALEALRLKGDWNGCSELLWQELGNLRTGIGVAIAQHDAPAILGYSQALRVLFEAGLWVEFDRLAGAVPDAVEATGDRNALLVLFGLQGAKAAREGQSERAAYWWTRRRELAAELGDSEVWADCQVDLAQIAAEAGRLEEAEQIVRDTLRRASRERMDKVMGVILVVAAEIELARQRPRRAVRWATWGASWQRKSGDTEGQMQAHRVLGNAHRASGSKNQSAASYQAGLRLASAGERRFSCGWIMLEYSRLLEEAGDRSRAFRLARAAWRCAGDSAVNLQRQSREQMDRVSVEDLPEEAWRDVLGEVLTSDTTIQS